MVHFISKDFNEKVLFLIKGAIMFSNSLMSDGTK